jgi:hypothetical protein
MTTPEECICCVEVPTVHSQMLSEDMQCITDSDILISNCLNPTCSQSGSRNRWCKAYEGFYYTVGKKRNRYGANVNERTSHLRIDWVIKNRHIGGHTIFRQ